jgi:hypothetical protein
MEKATSIYKNTERLKQFKQVEELPHDEQMTVIKFVGLTYGTLRPNRPMLRKKARVAGAYILIKIFSGITSFSINVILLKELILIPVVYV